jgi:rifampicin phosphotransferase
MTHIAASPTDKGLQAGATALPTPPDFPVRWEQPEHAQLLWLYQRMHFPEPITPLDEWYLRGEFEGIVRAARHYELPFGAKGKRINTYAYATLIPTTQSGAERKAQSRRAEEKVIGAMANLMQRWEEAWLPEVQAILCGWAAFKLPSASTAELVAYLDEVMVARERLWEIHFELWFPAYGAISLFGEFYCDLFGPDKIFEAYRLVQGFESKTVETTRALWQLSRKALTMPAVQAILQAEERGRVLAALEEVEEGQLFLAELQRYLQEYGQRSEKWVISSPSWIEDPAPVIESLREYMRQPERALTAELATQALAREESVTAARQALKDHPQATIDRFEFLLKAAQAGSVLTEDHGFWIDQRGWYPIRLLFLEFGRRFAKSAVLEQPEDIFYLTLAEVRATALALPRSNRRPLVAGRQAEMAYFRDITPPPALGARPSVPAEDDFLSRTRSRFFGAPPPLQEAGATVVKGTGASPGSVRGPARVIRTLAEAARLQAGDILVAPTTSPSWTTLFATAAAVVTDTGGVLSHCAIVAREYGIPAVVGTGTATTAIRDGQLLEVDGRAGVVHILE